MNLPFVWNKVQTLIFRSLTFSLLLLHSCLAVRQAVNLSSFGLQTKIASCRTYSVSKYLLVEPHRKRSKIRIDPRAATCAAAVAQSAVCAAANRFAFETIRSSGVEATTVMQNVNTGALVVFASRSAVVSRKQGRMSLTPGTLLLPLSLSKLMLAASWWDRKQPDRSFDCLREVSGTEKTVQLSIHDMLGTGCDLPAKQMASALRDQVGAEAVVDDLRRYGFRSRATSRRDPKFWALLEPSWRQLLIPFNSSVWLDAKTSTKDWEDTLSLGETNILVTPLHISSFLQAVGNAGVQLSPSARGEKGTSQRAESSSVRQPFSTGRRIMSTDTSRRLQLALRDAVQRGTAKAIANSLSDTGWSIGGKTGSGPRIVGPDSDGWFAGLIFDPQENARYTVVTFVRHGGPGGGNAAKISANLARYIINR